MILNDFTHVISCHSISISHLPKLTLIMPHRSPRCCHWQWPENLAMGRLRLTMSCWQFPRIRVKQQFPSGPSRWSLILVVSCFNPKLCNSDPLLAWGKLKGDERFGTRNPVLRNACESLKGYVNVLRNFHENMAFQTFTTKPVYSRWNMANLVGL